MKKSWILLLIWVIVSSISVFAEENAFSLETMTEPQEVDKGPQEIVLDEYFDAVNHLDKDRVLEISNRSYDGSNKSNYDYFVKRLRFVPGIYNSSDFIRLSDDAVIAYFGGLGYEGSAQEMLESYKKDIDGNAQILFSNFNASYILLDLKKAEECRIQRKSGLKYIDIPDIAQIIKEYSKLDKVDEVWIAKIKVYWEYNGFPYGNDRRVWDVVSNGISYEKVIENYDEPDYYAFIYKADNKWYLYPDVILNYDWKVEM